LHDEKFLEILVLAVTIKKSNAKYEIFSHGYYLGYIYFKIFLVYDKKKRTDIPISPCLYRVLPGLCQYFTAFIQYFKLYLLDSWLCWLASDRFLSLLFV